MKYFAKFNQTFLELVILYWSPQSKNVTNQQNLLSYMRVFVFLVLSSWRVRDFKDFDERHLIIKLVIWRVTWHGFYVDSFILSDVVVLWKMSLLGLLKPSNKIKSLWYAIWQKIWQFTELFKLFYLLTNFCQFYRLVL